MGSADCRSYSRNKRGIAGGLIWINFDRHSLLNLFKKAAGKFVADVDEIRPQYQDPSVGSQAVFTSSLVRSVGPSIGSTIDQLDNLTVTEVGGTKELAAPWYSDQILPFDITIAGANEYGAMAAAKIFGVEILNEGWGSSIDDAVSEMQVGFGGAGGWARQASQNRSLPPVPSPASFLLSLPGRNANILFDIAMSIGYRRRSSGFPEKAQVHAVNKPGFMIYALLASTNAPLMGGFIRQDLIVGFCWPRAFR
jgi:hypothetical protein